MRGPWTAWNALGEASTIGASSSGLGTSTPHSVRASKAIFLVVKRWRVGSPSPEGRYWLVLGSSSSVASRRAFSSFWK